jgi:hypothetical protein
MKTATANLLRATITRGTRTSTCTNNGEVFFFVRQIFWFMSQWSMYIRTWSLILPSVKQHISLLATGTPCITFHHHVPWSWSNLDVVKELHTVYELDHVLSFQRVHM